MDASALPETAGSIIRLNRIPPIGGGNLATLTPTGWNPRSRSFDGLFWCAPVYTDDNRELCEVRPVPDKLVFGAEVEYVAGPPRPSGKRPLRRPGAIALLQGVVYTHCPVWLDSVHPEHVVWLNPDTGVLAAGDVERHGTELVPGMP